MMRTRRIGRIAAAAVLVGAALGVHLGTAGPASAATPTCSKVVTHDGALVPAAGNNSVNCNMVRGNWSEAVGRLQDTMNDCYPSQLQRIGVWPLAVDWDFGGRTQRALVEVQKAAGTAPDGIYGPNTRRAMLHQVPLFADPCKRVS